jgi:hypothetical protein
MNNSEIKDKLAMIFIHGAEYVNFTQANGASAKALLVKIPFRTLAVYQKICEEVIKHLEAKFKCSVLVIAARNIVSKRGMTKSLKIISKAPQESNETKKQSPYGCPSRPSRRCLRSRNHCWKEHKSKA